MKNFRLNCMIFLSMNEQTDILVPEIMNDNNEPTMYMYSWCCWETQGFVGELNELIYSVKIAIGR